MDSKISGGNSSHRMQYSYLPETVLKLVPQLNFPRDNNTTAYTFICDHHAPDNDFRFIIDVYVVCVICLFGFVGNALTIVVLRHDKDRLNSTNWLLQTLALVDTAYLIACLVIQPVKAMHDSGKFESHLYPYIEMYFWTIAGVAQTITVWTVVLVTIDRYIAVCKPFKAELRSLTRTKCSMFGVVLAAIIYNSPLIYEREIKMKQKDCSTDFVPFAQTTEIVSNKVYSILYKTVCYLVFRTIGPLVTLTILNIRLVQSLRMVHQKQKRNSSRTASARSNRQRENLTLMLVVVITVFIVCELPDTGLRLAVIVNTDILPMMTPANNTYFKSSDVVTVSDASKLTFSGVNTIANMLLALNSAVNFIIYCLVGKKFRRILCVHLCRVTNLAGDSSITLGGGGAAQMKTLAVAVDDDKINAAAVDAPPASVVDEQIKCETET